MESLEHKEHREIVERLIAFLAIDLDADVTANMELTLISIYNVARDNCWKDICDDIASTGIDLNA